MASKPKKSAKRITRRSVQATEKQPYTPIPNVQVRPEVDEDSWGEADCLTEKQRRFVFFYMGEAAGNATKAAQLAGYRDDNRNALAVTAHGTLRNPNVQRAIEAERGKRFGTMDDVRRSIAAIANGNAADYLTPDKDGNLHLDLNAMAEAGALGLLQQVQEEQLKISDKVSTVKLKLKLYDRLKALELLAKMNGQLKEHVEHSGEVKFHPITLDGDKHASDNADDS